MSDVKRARPLSPHLQIYRVAPTMAMSVAHRLSGMALYGGAALFVWWIVALASGPEWFAYASAFFDSLFGRAVLFVYTLIVFHHMGGGIRHMIWDTGTAISKQQSTRLALATPVFAVTATLLLWLIVWIV